jgi:hypothetical protein
MRVFWIQMAVDRIKWRAALNNETETIFIATRITGISFHGGKATAE